MACGIVAAAISAQTLLRRIQSISTSCCWTDVVSSCRENSNRRRRGRMNADQWTKWQSVRALEGQRQQQQHRDL